MNKETRRRSFYQLKDEPIKIFLPIADNSYKSCHMQQKNEIKSSERQSVSSKLRPSHNKNRGKYFGSMHDIHDIIQFTANTDNQIISDRKYQDSRRELKNKRTQSNYEFLNLLDPMNVELQTLEETEKEMQCSTKIIEEEKNILINELKTLSLKLRDLKKGESRMKLKDKENNHPRHSNHSNLSLSSNNTKQDVDSKIQHRIVTNGYENDKIYTHANLKRPSCSSLLQKRQDYDVIPMQENILSSENNLSPGKSDNLIESQRKSYQKSENYDYSSIDKENRRDKMKNYSEIDNYQREGLEKRRELFHQNLIKREQKIKKEEESIAIIKKQLAQAQLDLENQEREFKERREKLEIAEKEFDRIAQRLEQHSDELINQKYEYSKKTECLKEAMQKLQLDRNEFINIEKDFQRKNQEFKIDSDKFNNYAIKLKREEEDIGKKNNELNVRLKEIIERENKLEQKERDFELKERNFKKEQQGLLNELDRLKKEKGELLNSISIKETKFFQKEQELNDRERALNERRETYDDFDLKLLGMKMNEELWQKKRDFEITNLMDEVKKLREKEKELKKREEKLNKQEDEIRKLKDNLLAGKSNHNNGINNNINNNQEYIQSYFV